MTITGRKATLLVGAFILSACLNVFAAAAWGTHAFQERRGHPGFGIGRLVRTAPEEARQVIHDRFEAARPEISRRVDAVREARADIGRVLRDPAVDPAVDPAADRAALEAAFAELRRRGEAVEVLVHGTLIDALGEMPGEARTRWAEAWSRRR